MTCNPVALYDTLNCAAMAVDEAESGRPGLAEAAWLEAGIAATGAFPPGSAGASALGMILDAASPARNGGRAGLYRALDCVSFAVLVAGDGDRDLRLVTAMEARMAIADGVGGREAEALSAILGAAEAVIGMGVFP